MIMQKSLVTAFEIGNRSFYVRSAYRPVTFLPIFDAPYKLPDAALQHHLASFGTVYDIRRNKYPGTSIHNGSRTAAIHIQRPIPCFLRFGHFQVRTFHPGQAKTCRKCNLEGHFASDCDQSVCFNCDEWGHVSKTCPNAIKCCICKSEDHMVIGCPFSWAKRSLDGYETNEDHPSNDDYQSEDAPPEDDDDNDDGISEEEFADRDSDADTDFEMEPVVDLKRPPTDLSKPARPATCSTAKRAKIVSDLTPTDSVPSLVSKAPGSTPSYSQVLQSSPPLLPSPIPSTQSNKSAKPSLIPRRPTHMRIDPSAVAISVSSHLSLASHVCKSGSLPKKAPI